MILFGGPYSFCLFSYFVYVVVPMHLEGVDSSVVDFIVVGFLVVDLQRSVGLLVEFLKWALQLDVSLGDLV